MNVKNQKWRFNLHSPDARALTLSPKGSSSDGNQSAMHRLSRTSTTATGDALDRNNPALSVRKLCFCKRKNVDLLKRRRKLALGTSGGDGRCGARERLREAPREVLAPPYEALRHSQPTSCFYHSYGYYGISASHETGRFIYQIDILHDSCMCRAYGVVSYQLKKQCSNSHACMQIARSTAPQHKTHFFHPNQEIESPLDTYLATIHGAGYLLGFTLSYPKFFSENKEHRVPSMDITMRTLLFT